MVHQSVGKPSQKQKQYGPSVTINSKQEKDALKRAKKEQKKSFNISEFNSRNHPELSGQELKMIRENQLNAAANAPMVKNPTVNQKMSYNAMI